MARKISRASLITALSVTALDRTHRDHVRAAAVLLEHGAVVDDASAGESVADRVYRQLGQTRPPPVRTPQPEPEQVDAKKGGAS